MPDAPQDPGPEDRATRLDTLPGGPAAASGLAGFWYVAGPSSRRRPGHEPAASRDGYDWEFRGPGDPGEGPPHLDILDQAGYAFEMRTIPLCADWRLALENSLDFAHSAFVHAWTSPVWLLHHLRRGMGVEAEFRPTADGLVVDARSGGLLLYRHAFHVPDRMRLALLPDSARPMDVLVHHVPDGPGLCRMEVLVARRCLPWERPHRPGAPIPFRPGALRLHQQDVRIVEAQHAAWSREAPAPERHCAADAYTLLLRRVLRAAAAGRRNYTDLAPARTVRFCF